MAPSGPDVSVVIPAYNSAEWLPTTLEALRVALDATSWAAEVVVVDDGSTDGTADVLASIGARYPHPLRVVPQDNLGVFVAVWEGLRAAESAHVLILNSRLLLHPGALAYLAEHDALGGREPWNGHVVTDPQTPLVGRFWEVPTGVFWSSYLANPRPMLITPDNFDRVPKGTGCLLIDRDLMLRAYDASWPAENARFTSDDTKLLRFVAREVPIRLEPGFSATYRPRTTVRRFLSHARNRGTLFVDSYGGTSPARSAALVGLGVAPPLAVAGLAVASACHAWRAVAGIAAAAAVAVALPAAIGGARRVPRRALVAYVAYILPFGVAFWRGLVRGLVIHRATLWRRAEPT
ncbi:glycosyltransferase family 2 protein [Actinotalea fermentans]|uniref:Glycosyltransferase 2-like domain-containing protein n=1 Tax=Actinotalea fermentans TaxID=43671 RepID=A0A511YSU5_9CELL|nr:glycosyltransferase family 2 protein [Actinotalea fermentans]KGM16672.1 hypothetical protein N867_17485 [Actinotalea fermentans ATCC 43279 = JCM 9966 = DSM 3133]GEN78274.1 hypothetical protein AFE02nite_00080 [Actinotalea fermentans]